ncbi:MAG TPA: DUF6368 family protein [Humisphaera sp.]|jgi:hypothetical protein|nr:DUF6368 family protein [Humisphaera sp.]
MAGPIAGVLLPRPLSEQELAEITLLCAELATNRVDAARDHYLYIPTTAPIGGRYIGRPVPLDIDMRRRPTPGTIDETIFREFGFRPAESIGLSSDINGPEAHQILGEFCIYFADKFQGIVDFNGPLLPSIPLELYDAHPGGLSWDDVRALHEEMVSGLPGRLVVWLYTTVSGRQWASNLADATFMRAWLAHPCFHMIK